MIHPSLFLKRIKFRFVCALFSAVLTWVSTLGPSSGQAPPAPGNTLRAPYSNGRSANSLELILLSRADCPSNLILLSDLVTVQGSDVLIKNIMNAALGPAPKIGTDQSWSRGDIEKSLVLRGIAPEAISWKGANDCLVRRIPGPRIEPSAPKKQENTNAPNASSKVQQANYQESPQPIDPSQFTTPFITQTNISQAENLAALAIGDYLRTKTDSFGRWNIQVNMPTEHTKIFSLRTNILGVAGGVPPWDGPQEFSFRVKGKNGEQVIPISATVRLPEMVVAAKRALSKGYVLREEDLVWIPMPRGLNYGPEDCFSQTDALVGQQLRRAMSTQQVIRLKEVGPPTIIHVGDLVTIGIVSGDVSVLTNGRALESGSMDDLIQIEVQPHRKRVHARITGDRKAEVISNGAAQTGASNRTFASKSSKNSTR